MEFPTTEQFEQNKVQNENIFLKWREVPTGVIYYIEKIEFIATKEGEAIIVSLVDKNGEKLKAFATNCLSNDLVGYKGGWFIKSNGKQKSSIISNRSYYQYEIMKS